MNCFTENAEIAGTKQPTASGQRILVGTIHLSLLLLLVCRSIPQYKNMTLVISTLEIFSKTNEALLQVILVLTSGEELELPTKDTLLLFTTHISPSRTCSPGRNTNVGFEEWYRFGSFAYSLSVWQGYCLLHNLSSSLGFT